MRVCLIQVPYMVGNEGHPAAAGPEAVARRALTFRNANREDRARDAVLQAVELIAVSARERS